VPHARRVADLRQPVHHDGGGQRHRDAVDPRLPPERHPGEPGGRVVGVGAAVPHRRRHRLRVHQGLQDRPVTGEGGQLMDGNRTSHWWTVWGLLILAWAAFPLVWMVSLSFKSPETFRSSSGFWPEEWTWTNFETVFQDELFTSALRNSAGIAVIATLLS